MADKSFAIRLVTPAGKLLDGQATYAMVPAHDGLMGFQPNRAPIVFELGLGELRVDFASDSKVGGGGGSRRYLIEDGFGQMANNRLTVLTTKAWAAEDLTESAANAELAAVEAQKPMGTKAQAAHNRDRERAQAKVRLARQAAGKGI